MKGNDECDQNIPIQQAVGERQNVLIAVIGRLEERHCQSLSLTFPDISICWKFIFQKTRLQYVKNEDALWELKTKKPDVFEYLRRHALTSSGVQTLLQRRDVVAVLTSAVSDDQGSVNPSIHEFVIGPLVM